MKRSAKVEAWVLFWTEAHNGEWVPCIHGNGSVCYNMDDVGIYLSMEEAESAVGKYLTKEYKRYWRLVKVL